MWNETHKQDTTFAIFICSKHIQRTHISICLLTLSGLGGVLMPYILAPCSSRTIAIVLTKRPQHQHANSSTEAKQSKAIRLDQIKEDCASTVKRRNSGNRTIGQLLSGTLLHLHWTKREYFLWFSFFLFEKFNENQWWTRFICVHFFIEHFFVFGVILNGSLTVSTTTGTKPNQTNITPLFFLFWCLSVDYSVCQLNFGQIDWSVSLIECYYLWFLFLFLVHRISTLIGLLLFPMKMIFSWIFQ